MQPPPNAHSEPVVPKFIASIRTRRLRRPDLSNTPKVIAITAVLKRPTLRAVRLNKRSYPLALIRGPRLNFRKQNVRQLTGCGFPASTRNSLHRSATRPGKATSAWAASPQ